MWISVDLKHITNKKCVLKDTLYDNLNSHLSSITMGHSPTSYAIAIMKCLHKVQSGYFKGAGLTVTHEISILSQLCENCSMS